MLTISQFSKISQIPTKTLRYYDEIKLLSPATIDKDNSYRYYHSHQLATVFLIQKLKNYDFSLKEIKRILDDKDQLKSLMEQRKLKIEQKVQTYLTLKKLIEADINALAEGGDNMLKKENIEVTESPELRIFSVRRIINVKDSDKLIAEGYNTLVEKSLTPIGNPIMITHSPEYSPENCDMEFGIPVLEEADGTRKLESNKSVKLHYIGLYEKLPQAYMQIGNYIEENNYEYNGPSFEVYLTDPNTTIPDKNEVLIYIPIK